MKYEKYKEFVLNYKPFEWEINHSDFREYYKGKHNPNTYRYFYFY